jgi:hypothetical protein
MPGSSIAQASDVQMPVEKADDFDVISAITEYVKLDNSARNIKDQISALQKEHKAINVELKKLEKPIIVSLTKSNYSSITINDGSLKPKVEKRMIPTNKDYVLESIKEYFILNASKMAESCSSIEKIEEMSADMCNFIMKQNRKYKETSVLSRKINK